MLLTCDNCQTIFRVNDQAIAPEGQHVRCSVCEHVWHISRPQPDAPETSTSLVDVVRRLRTVGIILLVLVVVSTGLFALRGPITASLPGLIPSFQLVGLSIRPDLNILEVRNLNAVYQGNVLRIRGELANLDSLPAHASALNVTVLNQKGERLAAERIRPEDSIITPAQPTSFFVQIEVEAASDAQVIVTPIDDGLLNGQ